MKIDPDKHGRSRPNPRNAIQQNPKPRWDDGPSADPFRRRVLNRQLADPEISDRQFVDSGFADCEPSNGDRSNGDGADGKCPDRGCADGGANQCRPDDRRRIGYLSGLIHDRYCITGWDYGRIQVDVPWATSLQWLFPREKASSHIFWGHCNSEFAPDRHRAVPPSPRSGGAKRMGHAAGRLHRRMRVLLPRPATGVRQPEEVQLLRRGSALGDELG